MQIKSISLSLPQEIISCLSRAEITVADLILDLCRYTAAKQPSHAFYTCTGQKFLAARIGVTREWISKCVNKLQRLGILRITRRRKVNEQWQTNIYRVGEALKKGWKTAKSLFLLAKFRVNSSAHIGTKKHISSKEIRKLEPLSHKGPPESITSVLEKCRARIESWNE
jgi:hypothetical protein